MNVLSTSETISGVQRADKPRTVGEAIRRHAEARPKQAALVASDFTPLSYQALQEEIDSTRSALRAAGLSREARIAVAIANSAQAARAIIAVTCSAAAVPIDPKLTVAEVERCLLILRPDAVLVLNQAESAARTAAEQRGFPLIEAAFTPGLTLQAPQIGAPAPLDEPDAESPAFILHTSGTTADPNLVPFSHRNMMAVIERLKTWYELTPQDRCLNVSPVYYSHALTTTILPPLMTGGSVAFPSNPTNVDLQEWFGELRPTWYSAGPTLHLSVLEKAETLRDARTMHSLRFMSSAGAPIAREVHERIQTTLGVPVLEHYGSSETAQIASNRLTQGGARVGTCGVPWPGIIKLADDDGVAVLPGERGEIWIRGPSVMSGYLNAPERNRSIFADGWYRTGDVGSLDADGFLTLHGREKELINRGGEKIAPLEIDQALLRHPQVAQAAAFGVPHPRLGEDVAAAVVLHEGASVTPAELREFVSEGLASFKLPRRITIVDQLPKGITGKVQRKRLSEALRDKPEKAANSEQGLEASLLALFRRVLKTDQVSPDDDFFEKGGDSLLAMDVSLELQKLVGKELPESILFEAPTIRDLSKRLTEETS
jgi:oxalate---CoA ligase